MFQTHTEGAATRGLAIGDDPTHPGQAQRETLRNRQGYFDTLTAVAIPQAYPEGQPSPLTSRLKSTCGETVPPVFAMPVSGRGLLPFLVSSYAP